MTGWEAGSPGIDPARVAELLVDRGDPGPGRRGSGYRISATAVLTAAHVLRDAARVRVRFNADRPGEWMTEGTVAWSDSTVDAAVVRITPRPQDKGEIAPVAFGRVAERDAFLECSAMGFPRFKLRNDEAQPLDDGSPSQYRDSVHAVGTIAVLSNRRQGTLEVSVPPPERDPGPERSPWEGMSGAAVFSRGRIIGLVAEHHRADGLGRLTATRVDHWYEHLAVEQLDQLRTLLPALPADASGLVDVLPPTSGELLEAGYTAQVRDIAPEQLVGREQELEELVQFCAGEERYQWWRADPWAGKSALAAWFVLHAPAGVSVVSFFVTGRLAGQADSDAFTEAMIEQLAAVAGESVVPGTVTALGRDRERRRLLDQAGARVGERAGRLLFVVDGLDEDEGARPRSGKPSIASLLPKRPPHTVRILVTSRPHPDIPNDVPGDHPLRRCVPRPLAPSRIARDVRVEARRELLEQLHGDALQVDVLGFITASGGGLTLGELAELTGQPEWTLDGKLGSVFGRSLKTRTLEDRTDRVYLFAHETLRVTAERELARAVGPYRQRIDVWADTYRTQGWPDTTPRYLLRPYGRLLAISADLDRLVSFATDAARHHLMLAYTYGDASALAEIADAQRLLLAQPIPDLVSLACLAAHRDGLADRSRAVPMSLLTLWARLGDGPRGEALARSITNPDSQAQALQAVAAGLAEAGQWEKAEDIARSITNPHFRDWALRRVAEALAGADQWEQATQTARRMTDPHIQALALQAVAEVLAQAGRWKQAELITHRIAEPDTQAQVLAGLAKALAGIDPARTLALMTYAEKIARGITDLDTQARTLAAVGEALVEIDRARALAIMADAAQAAHRITNCDMRDFTLTAVAEVLAGTGRWDRAEEVARSITNADTQAQALHTVAEALAGAGHYGRAEQIAHRIAEPDIQALALYAVVKALAEASHWEQAVQTARCIAEPDIQVQALHAVVEALAKAGRWERAEQIAHRITHPQALQAVAKAYAEAGRWEQAEQTARSITDYRVEAQALQAVAEALAGAGQWQQAEDIARSITHPDSRIWAMQGVVKALAETDQPEQATQIAYRITDPHTQAQALQAVAKAQAGAGRWEQAEQTARSISNLATQAQALILVAEALAKVDPARALALMADAERSARRVASPDTHARALQAVAKALAEDGRWEDAEQSAHRITSPDAQAWALRAVVEALAEGQQWEQAERIARSITRPYVQSQALCAVAKGHAKARQLRQAKHIARSITDPDTQAYALQSVVEAHAEAEQWEQAEHIAHSITDPVTQVRALTAVAAALAEIHPTRALTLITEAEQSARRITNSASQVRALTVVAVALSKMDPARALVLMTKAERTAHSIEHSATQARALTVVTEALTGNKQWSQAEQSARSITEPGAQARALIVVAEGLAEIDPTRALALMNDAEQNARESSDRTAQAWALMAVAVALAAVGQHERAEQNVRLITSPYVQARAVTAVAEVLARAGQGRQAEQIGRSSTSSGVKGQLTRAITGVSTTEPARAVVGEPPDVHARLLLAEVLAGHFWAEAVGAVCWLNPSAVTAIDKALNASDSS
jgi:hypothetical protein